MHSSLLGSLRWARGACKLITGLSLSWSDQGLRRSWGSRSNQWGIRCGFLFHRDRSCDRGSVLGQKLQDFGSRWVFVDYLVSWLKEVHLSRGSSWSLLLNTSLVRFVLLALTLWQRRACNYRLDLRDLGLVLLGASLGRAALLIWFFGSCCDN